jgi:3-methyl-2-oxobutanoate hydroxymethyltransferase
MSRVTVSDLQAMKPAGRKIVGVVAWDFQIARIADRAGVDLVSVGDSVGMNLWGRTDPDDMTLDEMVLVCKAVRRGVSRALVSCDFPAGVLQQGTKAALAAARRVMDEGGADMVKLDGAAEFPEAVARHRRRRHPGVRADGHHAGQRREIRHRAREAPRRSDPGPRGDGRARSSTRRSARGRRCALIDFTSSGQVAGPQVARAVAIPVVGGLGGGPWLDGACAWRTRRSATRRARSSRRPRPTPTWHASRWTPRRLRRRRARAARQIKGGIPVKPA